MAFPGATETRLDQIVRGQRREARGQQPLAADQDPPHGQAEIVVGDPRRHAHVRKRAHVSVEKADLILALIDPAEVAARVHQAQQKEPRLPPDARDVDEHFEEVNLGQIARAIRQRDHDLAALPPPLGDRLFDQRHADGMALRPQQLMQPRGGQALLAARPLRRRREQRRDARRHERPDRPPPRRRIVPPRRGLREVLLHGDPRDPQLPRHGPLRPAFHQYLVSHDMHLIHPEHPLQRTPGPTILQVHPLGPQVVYFSSGEWISFRAARPRAVPSAVLRGVSCLAGRRGAIRGIA